MTPVILLFLFSLPLISARGTSGFENSLGSHDEFEFEDRSMSHLHEISRATEEPYELSRVFEISPDELSRTDSALSSVPQSNQTSDSSALSTSSVSNSDHAHTSMPSSNDAESPSNASMHGNLQNLTELLNNDSSVHNMQEGQPLLETSSTVVTKSAQNSTMSTTQESSTKETDKVVVITAYNDTLLPKTVFQKSIEWMESAYTLSILVPITAGVVFACTIITIIALCKCIRRRCRIRRLKRKALPDSVKNLRPSDRARLLAESSDEEF